MSMAWTFVRTLAMSAALIVCAAAQAQTQAQTQAQAQAQAQSQSAPAMAPPADAASRTLAHDIFQHVIGMETSVEGHQVPQMANYLAGLFRQAGFPESDIHIVPVGDT